jgi:hypothetical protein
LDVILNVIGSLVVVFLTVKLKAISCKIGEAALLTTLTVTVAGGPISVTVTGDTPVRVQLTIWYIVALF